MMDRVAGEHGIAVSEPFTPFATVMNAMYAMWETGVAADALKQVDALIPMGVLVHFLQGDDVWIGGVEEFGDTEDIFLYAPKGTKTLV